jgi:hypothetical protein
MIDAYNILFCLQDIFRKYPNKYESIIATLCENLENLDEPEARYVVYFSVNSVATTLMLFPDSNAFTTFTLSFSVKNFLLAIVRQS